MHRLLVSIATLLLAACGASNKSASGAPDAADVAAADAQPSPAASAGASAADLQVATAPAASEVVVGASGYGAVQFGMSREEVEKEGKAPLGKNAVDTACEPKGAAGGDIVYLFPDGKLQGVVVHTPGVMAEGGGRVGMDADEIRSLYAGRISEKPRADLAGGRILQMGGMKNDAALVFLTDAAGKVTAYRAGVGPVLDAACGG